MQRRQAEITIGFCPTWLSQEDWDIPIPEVNMTHAFPAKTKSWYSLEETTEDVLDCTGEDLLIEQLMGRFSRLNIEFDGDPDLMAGFAAFGYGVASSASGGTNNVQTLVITASSGTYKIGVRKGANTQYTAFIAYNANAAAIQAALELLSNVAPGDITVGGSAGTYTLTFGGDFQRQAISLVKLITYALVGGTATITNTTPGVGRSHEFNRLVGYTLPLLTLYIGFRNSDKEFKILKNMVVNAYNVTSQHRNRVTCNVQLIGSGDVQDADGYIAPPCMDIVPLRFGDCDLNLAGQDYIAANKGREFTYYFDNGVNPQFDGQGMDTTRAERTDYRNSGLNMFIFGEPGDPEDIMAAGDTVTGIRDNYPAYLQCGPAGRNVKYDIPSGILTRDPSLVRFQGDPSESELPLVVRPAKVQGDGDTSSHVLAVTAQQTAYLVAAS